MVGRSVVETAVGSESSWVELMVASLVVTSVASKVASKVGLMVDLKVVW